MAETIFPAFLKLVYADDGSAKGSFLRAVDDTLGSAEQRFAAFSGEAKRMVDAALSTSRTGSGSLDIGASAARAAAEAAQARAIAAQEIAAATEIAARAEGDYSEAARLAVSASQALAIEEEAGAKSARAHADALEQVQAVLNRQASATSAVVDGSGRMRVANDNGVVSAGQHRAAVQQLGYQFSDLGVQLSMAATAHEPLKMAMIAITQQGTQVVQALALMRGGAGGLIGFLGGPWGAGLMAAASVASIFATKLLDSGDAADIAAQKYANAAQAAAQYVGAANAAKLVGAQSRRGNLLQEQFDLEQLTKRQPFAADPNQPWYSPREKLGGAKRRLMEVNQELLSLTSEISIAERENAKAEEAAAKAARAAAAHTSASHGHASAVRASNAAMREATKAAKELTDMFARLNQGTNAAFGAIRERLGADYATSATAGINVMREDLERIGAMRVRPLEQAAEDAAAFRSEVDKAVTLLGSIGGTAGALGKVLSVGSGNVGAVGGAAGIVAQNLAGVTWTGTDKNGERVIRTLGEELRDVFGKSGPFADTLTTALHGAGIGMASSVAIFGQSGNNVGSAIGGALGEVAGKALGKGMSGILGAAMGPLGGVLGGVLGGALGNAIATKPRGSGGVTNSGVTSSANNAGIAGSIDSFGLGLQQAITSIASQLGARVGSYSVGIGRYKDYYQVSDVVGDSRLGRSYFGRDSGSAVYDGLDPNAALRAAIGNAIKDGAIQGVRAGTQALLKAGGDIEQQLAKALKFEGAFKDLRAILDPVGAAIDAVNTRFTDLVSIFKEAGASVADYADLRKLYDIERQKAVDSAMDQIAGSLKSLMQDLTSKNDTRSLWERETAARAAYDPLAARVSAGDTTAYDAYAEAAATLRDIERQIYGSTAQYFAFEDQVKAITQGAIDQQMTIAMGSQDNAAVVNAIDEQTATLNATMQAVNDNLITVAGILAQQSGASGGFAFDTYF